MSTRAVRAAKVRDFETVGRTETGLVRTLNEDAILAREELGLWAVADGMGGHARGEVASAAIIAALSAIGPANTADVSTAVKEALHQVNADLATAATNGVMGATVAALVIQAGRYTCVWAGDCRIYLLRENQLLRLTKDHSAVQEMVDAGLLTPEEARRDRRANLVTRAVGAAPLLELETVSGRVRAGDVFLLCSDGVSGVLSDEQIRDEIAVGRLSAANENLFRAVYTGGAKDNVSAVLVKRDTPKWVDTSCYVGFERRDRRLPRLINRRSKPLEAVDPPSTQAILRELRTHCLGLSNAETRDRFLVRLEGAIGLAAAHGDTACSDILSRLGQQLKQSRENGRSSLAIEMALSQAQESLVLEDEGRAE